MSLLIACLIIHGFGLSGWWYVLAVFLAILKALFYGVK